MREGYLRVQSDSCAQNNLSSSPYSLDISGSVSPEPPAGLPVKLEENLATAKAKRRLEEDQDAEENNESKKTRAVTTKRVLMSHLDRSDLTCKICGKEFRALYKLK